MRLDRVWVIYRADSQPAQREARQCAKELKALGSRGDHCHVGSPR